MRVIYVPRGPAAEYAKLACNLYTGCAVGCGYCYAPRILHKTREQFLADSLYARDNILANLEVDCKMLQKRGNTTPIFLCFTCDPFLDHDLALDVLETLRTYGQHWKTLTKLPSNSRDAIPLYRSGDSWGVTLTLTDAGGSLHSEPGADRPLDRIRMLKLAHAQGLQTWVSMEPVLSPWESLRLIGLAHAWADIIALGKLNHDPRAALIDWARYAEEAFTLCQSLGVLNRVRVKTELAAEYNALKQQRWTIHQDGKVTQ